MLIFGQKVASISWADERSTSRPPRAPRRKRQCVDVFIFNYLMAEKLTNMFFVAFFAQQRWHTFNLQVQLLNAKHDERTYVNQQNTNSCNKPPPSTFFLLLFLFVVNARHTYDDGYCRRFFTYNFLQEKIPKQDTTVKKLSRNAVIGFCSSVVSDTCSNSIRVVKVYKQVRGLRACCTWALFAVQNTELRIRYNITRASPPRSCLHATPTCSLLLRTRRYVSGTKWLSPPPPTPVPASMQLPHVLLIIPLLLTPLYFSLSLTLSLVSSSFFLCCAFQKAHTEGVTYVQAVREVIKQDGLAGLFGRGLKTKIMANGMQGLMFSVLWKAIEEKLNK